MKLKLALLALMLSLVIPAFAQDTPAAVEPSVVATQEAEPTAAATSDAAVTDTDSGNTSNDNAGSADPAITLKWWQVLAGIALAFGGGGLVGIAGVGVLAVRIKNDKATMTAIEGLANSVPAHVVKLILDTTRSTQAIAGVVEEVFDGVPIASKPAPVTAQSAG